ncbi:flagellar assembly protein FliH/type III secretion system HrpE [Sulfuricella denitrificans skB26]|uniref:Flagellar assembly protein FliH n=1 Tax=Sulfuricella denitrificans (strain DSM 22764 / NBRC 105220 / skB26) TaxID=1163617 RepID=S6ABW2_SULDS|nr:flagellar assembly protein FliH [Sulfuricella denitrificans]BAN35058.1 flagellar assembly protein FliH/type III secretion system HrpE [Sulfuricella denitrificans skB26]
MSSNIIPKEQLSAYQRWELNSLDGSARTTVPLPTAEEVENIQQQAYQEGFAAGYQEGKGKVDAELARLAQLMSALGGALNQFDETLTQNLLSLALDVAKQMLREALRVRPELVLPVIREAVSGLPQANQHPHLKLHPDDAALVRSLMADELSHFHWKLIEDSRVERGGCRVETTNSEIDATMENRWERILVALGREGAWLE